MLITEAAHAATEAALVTSTTALQAAITSAIANNSQTTASIARAAQITEADLAELRSRRLIPLPIQVQLANALESDAGDPEFAAIVISASILPKNTVAPDASSGDLNNGTVASVTNGTWLGATPMTFTYQWYKHTGATGTGSAISNETNATLTLPDDAGKYVYCKVTATNDAGSASAESDRLGPLLHV